MPEERFRLPDFLADERFLPLPDFRLALFLRADFLLVEPFLADFFAVERFRLVADFLLALFLPVDFLAEERFLPLPDFFAEERLRAPPDFLPPLSCLLTVRQARSSASSFDTPFFS